MAIEVKTPFEFFPDTSGLPLDGGRIYIGEVGLDPVSNPQTVYWDEPLTIEVAQPISTIGGFPARDGSAAKIYISGTYSIRVEDSDGALVFSSLENGIPEFGVSAIFTRSGSFVGDGVSSSFTILGLYDVAAQVTLEIGGAEQAPDRYTVSAAGDGFSSVVTWLGHEGVSPEPFPLNADVVWNTRSKAAGVPGSLEDLSAEGFSDGQASVSARTVNFDSRTSLVTWWGLYSADVPAGAVLSDGAVSYTKMPAGHALFGTDPIADLPGLAPFGAVVHPEHWAENTAPGITDMRDAIFLADQYAASVGLPLVGLGLCAFGDRLNLDAKTVRLRLVALSAYAALSYVGAERFFVRAGSDVAVEDRLDWDIEVDGANVHGNIQAGWDASSGAFPDGYLTLPGGSASAGTVAATAAVSGEWYRVDSVGTTDFTLIGAATNEVGSAFEATGAGTGDGTLTPLAKASVSADDVFVVTEAGTVDGETFAVGDRLRALVATPSTSTYTANWIKAETIYAVQANDVGSHHADFRIRANNCDVGFHVFSNSERITAEVTARNCITAVVEESDSATPDNNTFNIRGGSCAQWYVALGTLVTDVQLNTQASLAQTYSVPVIYDAAGRYRHYRGIMRTNQGPVVIAGATGAKVRWDVHMESPMSAASMIAGAGIDCLEVSNVDSLIGAGSISTPLSSVGINETITCDLALTVANPINSPATRLGSTSGSTTFQGNFTLHLSDGGDADMVAIRSERSANSRICYTGEARKVEHLAGAQNEFFVPVSMVSGGVPKEFAITAGSPVVNFVGAAGLADFEAYTWRARGMRGHISGALQTPIFYTARGTASGWQQAAREDAGVTT